MPKPLSRRTFLRGVLGGAAVTFALPRLEAMLGSSGTSYADGADLPNRFGVWFWGNGVRREHWIPDGTGTAWTPRAQLAPLEGVRDHLSVVTGLEVKTATHPHHSGMAGIMTGAKYYQVGTTRDTIVSTFAYPSIDQVAADAIGGDTPFRSLEVGITRFRGTDEGTTFQHLSHNGPNNVNPSEYSPAALFERLFGSPPEPQVNAARASVLDAVTEQIRGLQNKVGVRDRIRLEQHAESVRSIEKRLRTPVAECATPPAATDHPDVDGLEQIEAQNMAMSDLLATALACDLTRVFSVLFSSAGSGVRVWQVGANESLHLLCHEEANPQPLVHAATVFTMQQLAYFLGRLRDTPEGDGNLLDHCSILCTTELSEGWNHTNDEFPVLIAGKGGGRLRGGVHYRSTTRENASLAGLTALRGAGVEAPSFGYGPGQVTAPIGALMP